MRTPGRHSVGDSLILNVTPSGARSWVARVRDASGRRRDIGLGPYSDLTLAEAREKARELRRAGRDGTPILTRAEKRRGAMQAPTFRVAAERVHSERKAVWRNGKHVDQWLATLEAHVFPTLGDVRVDAIGVGQVIEVLAPIWNRIPETARRVRQRVIAVLEWSHARDYRSTQISDDAIAVGLGPQAKRVGSGNFAAIPYGQIPEVLRKIEGSDSIGTLALRFLILTAARSGEVRGATWTEIDTAAETWTIPGSRMKAGREHVVPLSSAALAIVQRAAEISSSKTVVFPGSGGRPMSDATMSKALRTAGVTKEGGTVHGCRSSFRDWVSEETNFPGDVAEAALAHVVKSKVEAAYRRGNLLAKRRDMMAAWANFCDGVGADVVRIAAA